MASQTKEQRFEEQLEKDAHANAMYLVGGYNTCKRLLSSPRFNKPQREIIEEVAYDLKERCEAQGLNFENMAEA